MKEIIYTQNNPQMGLIKGILRVIGSMLYFKFNNHQYSKQVIDQLKAKGAEIEKGRGWIRVNMFKDNEFVKLGDKEFNVKENTDEENEEILINFYVMHFRKSNFVVEEKE